MESVLQVLDELQQPRWDYLGSYYRLVTKEIRANEHALSGNLVREAELPVGDQEALVNWLQSPSQLVKLLLICGVDPGCEDAQRLWAPIATILKKALPALGIPCSAMTKYLNGYGFQALPKCRASNGKVQKMYAYENSRIFAYWAYDPVEATTQGIIVLLEPAQDLLHSIETLLLRLKCCAYNPTFLGFVVGAATASKLSDWSAAAYRSEQYTEQGNYRTEPLLSVEGTTQDKEAAAKEFSDRALHAARDKIRLRRLGAMLRAMQEYDVHFHSQDANANGQPSPKSQPLAEWFGYLIRQVEQTMDVCDYLVQDSAPLHTAAQYNINALKEQAASRGIAETSRELSLENRKQQKISIDIAKASRRIAEESKRDSSAMMTLAAATMVFLPGTFVASIFSTPIFKWSPNGGLTVATQIWVYWAVTIPVTLLTLAVWWVWMQIKERKERRENARMMEKSETFFEVIQRQT